MAFEFIKISVNGEGGGREALNRLIRGGRIISVKKEFVALGEDSFWAFCVEYLEGDESMVGSAGVRRGSGAKVDYREVLEAGEFLVFSQLRELRKTIAEQEGVPVYAIFTNEQLAAMVTGKVDSVSGIEGIAGVGAARVGKYGERFLAVLNGLKGGQA